MTTWYYADSSHQRQGPVDAAELARLHAQGQVRSDTLVWRDGMGDWQPLGDFAAELAPGSIDSALGTTPVTTAVAPMPDASTSTLTADPRADSPYAPPNAPLLHAPGVHPGGEIVYAGFWKRVAAYMIDGTIVGIAGGMVGGIIGAVLGGSFGISGGLTPGRMMGIQVVAQIVSLAISATYFAYFHASRAQATPGKMAVGIKVTRGDGGTITVMRGVGRYFALIVSGLILGIGFLMAAFTQRKQGLHDLMCDTLVVDKWAFTATPQYQRRELGTVTIVILVLGALLIVGTSVLLIGVIASLAGGLPTQ